MDPVVDLGGDLVPRTFGPRLALRAGVLTLSLALAAPVATAAAATPRGTPVENRYQGAGTWIVTQTEVSAESGLTYRIVHPRDLGGGGFRHPILVWGNGTGSTPDQYTAVFRQLASWGFVVIGSSDTQQATGDSMLAAMHYLLQADLDPTSEFFGVLDPTEIGVLGHSQGAGGAVNAANHSHGLIDTAVPINLPDSRYVQKKGRFSVADLPTPTLLLGGSTDGLISSPGSLRGYYQRVPRGALGILRGADHLAIQRRNSGYLGYLTAWMMWQLQHDPYAGSAFLGPDREFRRNKHWQDQQERGLG